RRDPRPTRLSVRSFVFLLYFPLPYPPPPPFSTLSLHDALPISIARQRLGPRHLHRRAHRRRPHRPPAQAAQPRPRAGPDPHRPRSEEHTSELQSRENLVCRLLLEKKNKKQNQVQVRPADLGLAD